jgi:hypothetical protein
MQGYYKRWTNSPITWASHGVNAQVVHTDLSLPSSRPDFRNSGFILPLHSPHGHGHPLIGQSVGIVACQVYAAPAPGMHKSLKNI